MPSILSELFQHCFVKGFYLLPVSLCATINSPGGAGLSTNPVAFQKAPMDCRHLTSLFQPLTFLCCPLSPSLPVLPRACPAPTTMQEAMSWWSHGTDIDLTHMGTRPRNAQHPVLIHLKSHMLGRAAQQHGWFLIWGKGYDISVWETQRKDVRNNHKTQKPPPPKRARSSSPVALGWFTWLFQVLSSGWALVALTHCYGPSKSPTHSD